MITQTGYPSKDKPWMKYYTEEIINAPLPECTIYELLWENNKNNLDDTALIYFDNKITYRRLFAEIEQAARALLEFGVTAGKVVTVITTSCVNSIVLFYAINRIGAISNYINVLASAEEFEKYFSEAESEYIFSLDLFAYKALEAIKNIGRGKLCVFSLKNYMPFVASNIYSLKYGKKKFEHGGNITFWKDFMSKGECDVKLPAFHDCRTVSIYAHTTGTTGFPKTVLHTDFAYNAVVSQYETSFPHERGEIFLNIIVPFVTYGMLTCMHMPLCLGLTLVVIPKYDAADLAGYIHKYHPNHLAGIPSYFVPMLTDKKMKEIDLSCIHTLAAGGEGFTEKIERSCNDFLAEHGSATKVMMGYGLTEACSSVISGLNEHNKVGSVGVPLVKNNVRVWDNELNRECTYDEEGEVQLYSPSLMVGYKDHQNEQRNMLVHDADGTVWIKTGDIGKIDKDGFLYIVGRMKRFLLVGPNGLAYKILPKPIEEVIAEDKAVAEVCVVSAHNDNGTGAEPKAFVVLNEGEATVEAEERLRQLCTEKLPDYMRPFAYEFLEAMPKNAVGKIDIRKLENWDNRT